MQIPETLQGNITSTNRSARLETFQAASEVRYTEQLKVGLRTVAMRLDANGKIGACMKTPSKSKAAIASMAPQSGVLEPVAL